MKQQHKREGIIKVLHNGGPQERATFHVELMWKKMVENKIHQHLIPTGFIPDSPHNMEKIISEGRWLFIDPELESEATVSSAVAAAPTKNGYSGVGVIAPFGCLPGRLIEGVYAPWAKAKGYPVIAFENDGQPYPPNTLSRMELFVHNVARFASSHFAPGLGPGTAHGRQLEAYCRGRMPNVSIWYFE